MQMICGSKESPDYWHTFETRIALDCRHQTKLNKYCQRMLTESILAFLAIFDNKEGGVVQSNQTIFFKSVRRLPLNGLMHEFQKHFSVALPWRIVKICTVRKMLIWTGNDVSTGRLRQHCLHLSSQMAWETYGSGHKVDYMPQVLRG